MNSAGENTLLSDSASDENIRLDDNPTLNNIQKQTSDSELSSISEGDSDVEVPSTSLHATGALLEEPMKLPVLRLGVNEAIEQVGFGMFQWVLLLLCGCIYIADSMEIMLLSFLSKTLACEWNLDAWKEASISTGG